MNPTRLLSVLLALSLAGHAAWLASTSRQPRHDEKSPRASALAENTGRPRSSPAPASPDDAVASEARQQALAQLITSGDLGALDRQLVEAGLDARLRRDLLQLLLTHRYADRFRAIYPESQGEIGEQWWRNPDWRSLTPADHFARQKAMNALQDELQAELTRVTGEDPREQELQGNKWLARQFSGLPKEKALALHRLQSDYAEMEQEIRGEAGDFQLPADAEKLRLLLAEKERDIAALLTPEERATWEMRASPSAERARQLATQFQASEEEYREIYALQKAFDAEFGFDDPFAPEPRRVDWQRHNAAQRELDAAVRALVGEERHLAAKREQDSDYLLARSATTRLGLAGDTPSRIYGLRAPVAAESQRIARDPALSREQKHEALARLEKNTRTEVERSLGAEAAKVFFERGGLNWITPLAHGSALQVDPVDGRVNPLEAPAEPVHSQVPTIRID